MKFISRLIRLVLFCFVHRRQISPHEFGLSIKWEFIVCILFVCLFVVHVFLWIRCVKSTILSRNAISINFRFFFLFHLLRGNWVYWLYVITLNAIRFMVVIIWNGKLNICWNLFPNLNQLVNDFNVNIFTSKHICIDVHFLFIGYCCLELYLSF